MTQNHTYFWKKKCLSLSGDNCPGEADTKQLRLAHVQYMVNACITFKTTATKLYKEFPNTILLELVHVKKKKND